MSWLPISGTLPQYSTNANGLAADYYLKFYASGTSTPIDMATDSTGATLLAKCALSDDGYPITNPLDDSTRFIPHIDQDYRIVLYLNETDADSNDTGSAAFNIDGMILQVVPTGNAANITLRNSNIETQDDYDRSPWFVDVDDFTAGVGPHVIAVPAGWTPTNPDMRFYRLDASSIVTPLTPTATSSTTFTLIETLLSTDVIFIGDDEFRSMADSVEEQIKINAKDNFDAIKQNASTAYTGVVQLDNTLTSTSVDKALAAAQGRVLNDQWVTLNDQVGVLNAMFQTAVLGASGDFVSGTCKLCRVGDTITISGTLNHSSSTNPRSANGYIPVWARPSGTVYNTYSSGSNRLILIDTAGMLIASYSVSLFSASGFTISYTV